MPKGEIFGRLMAKATRSAKPQSSAHPLKIELEMRTCDPSARRRFFAGEDSGNGN